MWSILFSLYWREMLEIGGAFVWMWLSFLFIFPILLIFHGLVDVAIVGCVLLLVGRSYGVVISLAILKYLTTGAEPWAGGLNSATILLNSFEKWSGVDLAPVKSKVVEAYSQTGWSLHLVVLGGFMQYFMRRQLEFAKALLWSLILANLTGPLLGPAIMRTARLLPQGVLGSCVKAVWLVLHKPWLRIMSEELFPPLEDKLHNSVILLRVFKWLASKEFLLPADSLQARRSRVGTLSQMLQLGGKIINEFDLPAFIRSPYSNRLSEVETLDLMRSLGYPTNSNMKVAHPARGGSSSRPWWVGRSDWKMHLPVFKSFIQEELEDFRKLKELPVFKHSYTFGTIDSQIESISRYFYDSPVSMTLTKDDYDIVWDLVKNIYSGSRLAPISEIYRKWDKKMNVGVFASSEEKFTKYGTAKKMPRWEYIRKMGGHKQVISQWYAFFRHYPRMENFAQFFTKAEFLPPKKWKAGKVRTPVASMLPQYVSQMVWSGVQNHRFRPFDTPVKIGLPINGTNLSKIYAQHEVTGGLDGATHFAGDCTAFDSTVTGPILDVIKHVRKRGFKDHRSVKAISWLIDRNYDSIEKSLLVSSNTGDVYRKGSGLMTGHASTSADNSLAMVALYALAWRKLTRLPADDFLKYNTLSVYGDDHILSISKTAPISWTFGNVQAYLASCNIELREEVPTGGKGTRLEAIPFLSKMARKPNDEEVRTFARLGIELPRWVIAHDSEKLMGKMTAQLPNQNPLARAKRLQSYMYLCAHNPEAYEALDGALANLFKKYPKVSKELSKYTPNYDRVLRVWYDPKSEPKEVDSDLPESDQGLSSYGGLTIFDQILNASAALPDYFNPIMKNNGWAKSLQQYAGSSLFWPNELIQQANGLVTDSQVAASMRKSCYAFLEHRGTVPFSGSTRLSLLVRHWIFVLAMPSRSKYFLDILDDVDRVSSQLARWNFVLFAKDTYKLESASLSLKEVFLTIILSWIDIPFDLPETILRFSIPDVTETFSKAIEAAWNQVWVRVPVAFRALGQVREDMLNLWLITAKTGIGKSTTLVNYLYLENLAPRMIVVVPRSNLVHSLSRYMNSKFGEKFTGLTAGLQMDMRRPICYMTCQEYIINLDKFSKMDHILLVDECHIDEMPYRVLKSLVLRNRVNARKVIFLTATPDEMREDTSSFQRIDFPQPRLFTIDEKEITLQYSPNMVDQYAKIVLEQLVHTRQSSGRALIFVDSLEEADQISRMLPMKHQILHSRGETEPDPAVEVYIGTSMVDVGITIDGLSLVVTKDAQFKGSAKVTWECPEEHCGMSATYVRQNYERVSSSLLTQRKGRTGRTNNGEFLLVKIVAPENVISEEKWEMTPRDMVDEWVATNLPLHVLVESGVLGIGDLSEASLKRKIEDPVEQESYEACLKILNDSKSLSSEGGTKFPTQFTGKFAGLTLSFQSPFNFQETGLSSNDIVMNALSAYSDAGNSFSDLLEVMKVYFAQSFVNGSTTGIHLDLVFCANMVVAWKKSPQRNSPFADVAHIWFKNATGDSWVDKVKADMGTPGAQEFDAPDVNKLDFKDQHITDDIGLVYKVTYNRMLKRRIDGLLYENCRHGVPQYSNSTSQRVCLLCHADAKLPSMEMSSFMNLKPNSMSHFSSRSPLAGGKYIKIRGKRPAKPRPLRGKTIFLS
ncbi:RNA-dependent RNA polymerase [Botrytis cinerea fusarivirus 4]|uniref:RNA-dependent RNA polymerase n=1 Tax=Botrytis cinerea fusarivirus 4 TaxID=2735920 RepID=A0AAE7ALV2_9VIRU|nr:RNA-dependent RNA polymerase [Botrytis cinerea fusarivirus 4]QJT73716.1 RNA-dependent RNA polymerase [Botrytis cinerea fusarivirus 4]